MNVVIAGGAGELGRRLAADCSHLRLGTSTVRLPGAGRIRWR